MNNRKKAFSLMILRRGSFKWPPRNEAAKRARVARGIYKCAKCGREVRSKDKQLDHINPVVPTSGWDNFDNYIDRLYCDVDGFQVLCSDGPLSCHSMKSAAENTDRVIIRKEKKSSSKKCTKKVK